MRLVLPFLLLNVVISAVTMVIVLLIWQAAHPMPILPSAGFSSNTVPSATTRPAASYADQMVEITAVIGAGDINFEAITLKNAGKSAVDMNGWTLRDGKGDQYTFPAFTVFPSGAFQVFSRSGVNTSLELYWGLASAVWSSGAKVMLYDPSGVKRQEFPVP